MPFYAKRVVQAMQRAQTHDERVAVFRIETDNGIVGWGDSQGHYADVSALKGKNPWALVNDDGIGNLGARMALLDVCGKDAGVPVHALIGAKVRDRCPVSWWDIDMPPADWAAEARESVKRGHTSFKMKARPWRDILQQVEAVGKVVPSEFRFDIDFNGFLLNAARAETATSRYPMVPDSGSRWTKKPWRATQSTTGNPPPRSATAPAPVPAGMVTGSFGVGLGVNSLS
jgi:L-alanine-DL-glutamate epimerase-like enolase superfamily enzyme